MSGGERREFKFKLSGPTEKAIRCPVNELGPLPV